MEDGDIEVRGDSISALTWVQTERHRGSVVTNVSMVFTIICIKYSLDVKSTRYITGKENIRCDVFSRMHAL